jgi:hypothetical protein
LCDLWEEEVKFYREGKDKNETESIGHCQKNYYTDYKYNSFYEYGMEYTFDESILINNTYYAVSFFLYKRIL